MMRITLFLITNLAVLVVLSVLVNLLGLNQPDMDWTPLIILAGVVGMGGAFISLLMSKSIAKRSSGARVIDTPFNDEERWLVDTVHRQAQTAGIGQPEVAIFDSSAPNAFATGANRNASLVAVSTGLLDTMDRDEVEAVLGHEVSHVANGDMVTLSLIQGVLNTFVIILSQLVSAMLDRRRSRGYSHSGYGFGRGIGYRATYSLMQMVLGFLATLVVRWFSRQREYRADAGGARLAGRDKMIRSLQRLQELQRPAQLPLQMQALGINGGLLGAYGLKKLTMTHPPLEKRIAALRAMRD